jgi:hypothetical protein
LEASPCPALPASSARAADSPAVPSESPSLLKLALGVTLPLGIVVLAVWGLMALFRAAPNPTVPAVAPVSFPSL